MPVAVFPSGCRALLLGSAGNLEEMGVFIPLEESTAEGALILMRLDFTEYPSPDALSQLNGSCLELGMPPWIGNDIVSADPVEPAVYLTWQKGLAWIPVILGLLATLILPPLLTAGIWWILPDSVTSLIESVIMMGMMLLPMFLIMRLMKPLTAPPKPKEIEKLKEIEGAKE